MVLVYRDLRCILEIKPDVMSKEEKRKNNDPAPQNKVHGQDRHLANDKKKKTPGNEEKPDPHPDGGTKRNQK